MTDEPTPSIGSNRLAGTDDSPLQLARWLLVVAAMVFAMVVVGGITRLTGSGLSIPEWKPVTGVLPPLNAAGWQAAFGDYQKTPQYQIINRPANMTLDEFKFIYFWEWTHRLLGRLVGLVYAVPLVWFWWRKRIPPRFKAPLLLWLALGGLQGVAGWWMVASGLSKQPDVSHYRLAVHLLLAFAILGGLVWTALDLRAVANGAESPARITLFAVFVLGVLFLELLLGAFTAGLRAGHVSNTWPMMYGKFIPPGIDPSMETLYALPSHPVLLHFLHRWWAWVLVAVLIVLARRVRFVQRKASLAIHCAFGTQILLGIATVMTGVDITLAVLHQACAALVVATTVWGLHVLGRRGSASAPKTSILRPP